MGFSTTDELRSLSLSALGLKRRTFNALKHGGIKTLGQLAVLDERKLLAINGIGVLSIQEVQAAIVKLDVEFWRQKVSDDEGVHPDAREPSVLEPTLASQFKIPPVLFELPLSVLPLRYGTFRSLQHAGIATIGDLARKTQATVVASAKVNVFVIEKLEHTIASLEQELYTAAQHLSEIVTLPVVVIHFAEQELRALSRAGIDTVGDLFKSSAADLQQSRCISVRSMKSILRIMSEIDLAYLQELTTPPRNADANVADSKNTSGWHPNWKRLRQVYSSDSSR